MRPLHARVMTRKAASEATQLLRVQNVLRIDAPVGQ
jgi:hypothetical protein